ncbi:acid phosphatase [Sulfolobus sp. A20]|uniref:alkaline phosphatase family protein n=1 Tax=Saccharolobus sp. A20 TaxID=1891280 RepID=UPI0008460E4E|nr:alkaline phosphatase family protein [Sulfolobus sp. A20]AOL15612.1 acid phosphatase [Sulfolobus sp. A20]TRM87245.1 acid phosphatase [Sulfolobus sp. C3]TRM97795.1 acid phosphatase [Sulfolobus sp. E1]TRM99945.1 acid phosphatase [Sulfolobus sp. F1]
MESGKARKLRGLFFLLLIPIFISVITSLPTTSSNMITQTPIKHVVIIILENHAFDSIFGTYPFGYPPIVNNITLSLMRPVNYIYNLSLLQLLQQTKGNITWISFPYKGEILHPYYANTTVLIDPVEGNNNYFTDWNYGKMDGFINGSGTQSLAYISYQQAPVLWDYAEQYVLFDNYFSPELSVTVPNRVAYITGFPTFVNNDSPQFNELPLNETIVYQLSQYNISWGWYEYGYSPDFQILSPDLYLGYNNTAPLPLSLFKGANELNDHYFDLTSFIQQAKEGKLPSVSFVMFTGPAGYDTHIPGYDMHPPYNTTLAMLALTTVINSIMEGPNWNSTAIFITFDEGGGYFDQVPPPIVNGLAQFDTLPQMPNYFILGQRIPLIVISPYAKEGFIDNYTSSGYSILAFIDYNWRLPYLNPIVNEFGPKAILEAFNFSQTPRKPIILTPENWSYPLQLQYPVHYGYIATINNNYTAYQMLYKLMDKGNYSPPLFFKVANAETPKGSYSTDNLMIIIIVIFVVILFSVYLVMKKR